MSKMSALKIIDISIMSMLQYRTETDIQIFPFREFAF